MARIKILLPETFPFTTTIPVRITDVNFGGHVGNVTILSILHETRAQFLKSLGYTEMNMDGVGLIMSDVVIEFKSELFYGETFLASVAIGEFSKISFELFYKLEKKTTVDKIVPVAFAKTGMVCYDYSQKKITGLPESVLKNIRGL